MDVYKIVGKLVLDGKDQFNKDVHEAKDKGSDLAAGIGKALKVCAKVGIAAVTVAGTAIAKITKDSVEAFAEYEQLAGGVQKIFEAMDTSKIFQDAASAYKDLGMTANEYLSIINDVGASFASTMGAEAGYEAAKKGLTAISDYASGTGKNFDELQQKLALITRSTSSYQSIADQFSGILPATSEGFLEQAKAAGILSKSYKKLTDVPIEEYQKAVTEMLAIGVDALGLTGNTAAEAAETISGSLTMVKASWKNLLAGLADENADIDSLIDNLATSAVTAARQVAPRIKQILGGMSQFVTQMAPLLSDAIPVIVTEVVPDMLSAGVELLQSLLDGIAMNIDAVSAGAVEVLMMLVDVFLQNLPTIITVGTELIIALTLGISQQLPELLPVIVEGIGMAVAEILLKAPDFLDAGTDLIVALGDGMWNYFSILSPEISGWVEEHIFNPIEESFSQFFEVGGEGAVKLWEGFCNVVNAIFPGLGFILSAYTEEAVNGATKNFDGLYESTKLAGSKATEAAKTASANITQQFEAVPEAAKLTGLKANKALTDAAKIPVDAETPVSSMAQAIENDTSMETAGIATVERTSSSMETAVNSAGFDSAGKTAMEKFASGLRSMESTVLSAVDAIASKAVQRINNALQNIQNKANSVSIPGAKTGLDYVPYDDFLVYLHKGEAVLTATEAAAWRAGKQSGETEARASAQQTSSPTSGITIVQNIQTVPQTPVEFAAATEAYFEQARWSMA